MTKAATGLDIRAEMRNADGVMTAFRLLDAESLVNNFGMLSFHVNSRTFGASSTPGRPDNVLCAE